MSDNEVPSSVAQPDSNDDQAVAKKTSTKRKRGRTSTSNPVEKHDEKHTPLNMKKKILKNNIPKFSIPRDVRGLLKKITSHQYQLSEEDGALIGPCFQKVMDFEAVDFMSNCLLYYERAHNLVFRNKDAKVIERGHRNPKSVKYPAMRKIYDHYLCGMEEKHRYYVQSQDPSLVKPPKRVSTAGRKRTPTVAPYNLYIQEQWKKRREEFQKIVSEQGIPNVMKLLSKEWKANPALKEEFQKQAAALNAQAAQPVQESAL
uniref:Uncharacterized protein n=1 Tax=viral metagenome TaxID=1070528 RepID=A0A6C0BPB3_9ZZZZ